MKQKNSFTVKYLLNCIVKQKNSFTVKYLLNCISKFALMSNNKNQFTELLCNNLNEHLITATNTLDDSASEVYASKTHKANCLS